MKHLLIIIVTFISYAMTVDALPVEIEKQHIHSLLLGQDVSYSIILPEDYYDNTKRYPVLFMFHGIGGDNSSWIEYGNVARLMQQLSNECKLNQFIIVMPDGFQSYYCDDIDGRFPYESFFIKEFIPFIDNTYRTIPTAEKRAVSGFSMGGFGALSIALRHKDLFKAVGVLSASLRTDQQYMNEVPQEGWDYQWGRIFGGKGEMGRYRLTPYYISRSPYHILSKTSNSDLNGFGIMIDVGDKEESLCRSNEELHRLLLKKNIPHVWEVRQGGHDFECWRSALPKLLCFVDSCFNSNKKVTFRISGSSIEADIYSPIQNPKSNRKYPVIYVVGGTDRSVAMDFTSYVRKLENSTEIYPIVICHLYGTGNIMSAIKALEKESKSIRDSQRMRALVCVGDGMKECMDALQEENLFSVIICDNPIAETELAPAFVNSIKKYRRYPRLFIENSPDNSSYSFSMETHILMREENLKHEYRSRQVKQSQNNVIWKEWMDYINKGLHL